MARKRRQLNTNIDFTQNSIAVAQFGLLRARGILLIVSFRYTRSRSLASAVPTVQFCPNLIFVTSIVGDRRAENIFDVFRVPVLVHSYLQ